MSKIFKLLKIFLHNTKYYFVMYFYNTKYYFLNAIRNSEYSARAIAIDFDGVLAEYEPGMASRDEQGLPIDHARVVLEQFKKDGYRIIIWTSRPITRNLKKWFGKFNIPYDFIVPKPDCYYFIDDRAIQFRGNWKETMKEIENFKEWWR